jgi:hypothetical protein
MGNWGSIASPDTNTIRKGNINVCLKGISYLPYAALVEHSDQDLNFLTILKFQVIYRRRICGAELVVLPARSE